MKIVIENNKFNNLLNTNEEYRDIINNTKNIKDKINTYKTLSFTNVEEIIYLFQEYILYLQKYIKFDTFNITLTILNKDILNISEQKLNKKDIKFCFYKILDDLHIWITHIFIFKDNSDIEYLNDLILNNSMQFNILLKR